MRIRKYIAPTMKEAIGRMRSELGEDAVILSSRALPKANGRQGEMVEITGAIDTNEEIPPRPAVQQPTPSATPNALEIQRFAEMYAREAAGGKPRPRPQAAPPPRPASQQQPAPRATNNGSAQTDMQQAAAFAELHNELRAMNSRLQQVSDSIRFRHSASLNALSADLYKIMLRAGIGEELALEALARVAADSGITTREAAFGGLRQYLASLLEIMEDIESEEGRCIVALVGPTGAGKTSTIAKLATISHIVNRADVLLVSADTFRIGSMEQLQTIAGIANIPFRVAYNPQEMRRIVKEEVQRDFIFIDTVGRSPNNTAHLNDLKAMLDAAKPDKTLLVQSATSSEASLRHAMQAFALLRANGLVLTKLDEAVAPGVVLNVLRQQPLALAYFTTGQSIPDDIEAASRKRLVELVIGDDPEEFGGEQYAE